MNFHIFVGLYSNSNLIFSFFQGKGSLSLTSKNSESLKYLKAILQLQNLIEKPAKNPHPKAIPIVIKIAPKCLPAYAPI